MTECAAFGLDHHVRALCAVARPDDAAEADGDEVHHFLAGTGDFGGGNKLVMLQFRDDSRLIDAVAEWAHDPEIVSVAAAPSAALAAVTHAGAKVGSIDVSVVRLDASNGIGGEAPRVTSVAGASAAAWNPKGQNKSLAVAAADGTAVGFVDIETHGSASAPFGDLPSAGLTSSGDASPLAPQPHLVWDPHHANVLIAALGSGAYRVDTRQRRATAMFDGAALACGGGGKGSITSLDHNPNQMYMLATGGADGIVRYWDCRKTDAPLKEAVSGQLRAHDHAVIATAFNPFRDELLLTASLDRACKLWIDPQRPVSSAKDAKSAPTLPAGVKRGMCASLPQSSDAVHAACWSASSPWVFAACDYSGRVLVDEVPREQKMALLLAE